MTVMAGDAARTRFDSYHVDEFVYVINGQAALPMQDLFAQSVDAPELKPNYYPPALTGLRNDGSVLSSAHGLAL